MLCLESDNCKILPIQRVSTEIEIDVWSLMHHSVNQASSRLLTPPNADSYSQNSLDFVFEEEKESKEKSQYGLFHIYKGGV